MALEEIDTVFGKEPAGRLSDENFTNIDTASIGEKPTAAEI